MRGPVTIAWCKLTSLVDDSALAEKKIVLAKTSSMSDSSKLVSAILAAPQAALYVGTSKIAKSFLLALRLVYMSIGGNRLFKV